MSFFTGKEANIQRYFNVTPPAVHGMVLTLIKRGIIDRVSGQPRTIRFTDPEELMNAYGFVFGMAA